MPTRTNKRTGEVQEQQPDGSWATIRPGIPSMTVQTRPADPKLPHETRKVAADATRAEADASVALPKAEADARKAEADARKAQIELDMLGKVTADKRDELRGNLNSLNLLERGIGELEGIYTSSFKNQGLATPLEYAPGGMRESNALLNDASGRLAAFISKALELTGKQFDTPREQQLFIQSYLPQNTDRDKQIEAKISTLTELLNNARKGMSARLGTEFVPYQSVIAPPAGPTGGEAIATGDTATRRDPERTAALDAMIRSGVPYSKAAQVAKQWGGDALDSRTYAAAVRYAKANPGYKGSLADVTFSKPTTAIERGLGKLANSPLGAYGVASANALTAGTLDELSGNQADGQLAKDLLRAQSPGASLMGDITGSALGMTGLNAGLRGLGGKLSALATRGGGIGGDALYGAGFGAGESNENRLGGAGMGALAASGGNLFGRGIVSGAGRVARGVSDPSVRALSDRGISLTPGQSLGQGGILGRSYRAFEDAVESVPFLGTAIRQRKTEGLTDFNKQAFGEALSPIGGRVDGIGQDAIGEAQDLVSDAYGNALSGTNLKADLPFVMRANDAVQAGRRVPEFGSDVDYLAKENLGPMFGPGRSLDGEGFQSSLQDIAASKADFNKAGNVRGRNAAKSMDELRQAYFDLASRQAPGTNEALSAANSANRNVSILGRAVNSRGGPLITPADLRRASVNNTRKYGGERAAARGDIPFADLAQAGEAVMPNVVPNSGTTDRALATLVLPSVLGGSAAGSEALDLPAPLTALLAGLAGASTKTGNKAIQKLLVDRPEIMRSMGEELLRFRRGGAILGGSALLPSGFNN